MPYAELLIKLGKIKGPQNGDQGHSMGVSDVVELDDIIVANVGVGNTPHEQGTWFHPKLAIVFATQLYETERWLSPELCYL